MQLILRVQPSGGNDDTAYSSIAFEQDHSLKRLRIANHMHLWFSEIFQVHHLAELWTGIGALMDFSVLTGCLDA